MTLVHEKVRQAVELLREADIDCWVTFVRESEVSADPMLSYILGAHVTWHSAFVICRSGRTCAVVGQGDVDTVRACGAYSDVRGYVKDFGSTFDALLQELRPSSIALNYSIDSEIADGLTHGLFLTFTRALERARCDARLVSAEAIAAALRGRKSASELVSIQKAVDAALEIFADVEPMLHAGMTEEDIAHAMHQAAAARACDLAWSADTCPGVFSGPDARDLHARPGRRRLEPGHLVYVDFGVRCDHYCSDLQRVYFVADGSGIPAAVQRGFDVLVQAIDRARCGMRPGIRGVEIDSGVRGWLASQGFDEFPHALGHQVGRFVHDGFALLGPAWEKYGQRPLAPLEEGMVFTIEPRVTVPGHGTVSVEEMVVVTERGAEFLSAPQTSLRIIRR